MVKKAIEKKKEIEIQEESENDSDEGFEEYDEENESEEKEEEVEDNELEDEEVIEIIDEILDHEPAEVEEEPEENSSTADNQAFLHYLKKLNKKPQINQQFSIDAIVNRIIEERGYKKIKKYGEFAKLMKDSDIVAVNELHQKLCIFFDNEPKLGVVRTREIADIAVVCQMDEIIVITNEMVTSAAFKFFQHDMPNSTITIFLRDQLRHFVADHSFVPKHEKLSSSEAEKYEKINKWNLPNLPSSDPIAKLYGWSPGTLIKITRKYGGTIEPQIHIRCIDAPNFRPQEK